MAEQVIAYETLLEITNFLAAEKDLSLEDFVAEMQEKIEERRKELSDMANEILELPAFERSFVLEKLGLSKQDAQNEEIIKVDDNQTSSEDVKGTFPLQELINWDVKTLTKTKPTEILINDTNFCVHSWSDVAIAFVEYLISEKKLTKEHLPFCPNKSSRKAYVNFFAGQPFGTNNSGLFKKISDDFYVDIKHNAKYHLLNIWWSLNALNILDDYKIEFVF